MKLMQYSLVWCGMVLSDQFLNAEIGVEKDTSVFSPRKADAPTWSICVSIIECDLKENLSKQNVEIISWETYSNIFDESISENCKLVRSKLDTEKDSSA